METSTQILETLNTISDAHLVLYIGVKRITQVR